MGEEVIARAMALAIEEARKGLENVLQNPPVGCVILSESGEMLAKGYHRFFGGPHAEIDALSSIADKNLLKNAIVVVTLEPCAHEGKTPSCAKALAQLPIRKLVYGLSDPNPLVSGKGAEIVRTAGIEVELFSGNGDIQNDLEDLAEIFLYVHRQKKAYVALKAGISANDSIVTGTKEKWITGPESRKHVHHLRSQYDAVLVGVQTVIDDDPRLDIRLDNVPARENFVVVLDPNAKLSSKWENLNLLKARSPDKIVWVVAEGKNPVAPKGLRLLHGKIVQHGFDLEALVQKLFELGIRSVFVEGGAKTYQGFLEARLINRIYLFQSPDETPAAHIKSWRADFKSDISFVRKKTRKFGRDTLTSLSIKRS